MGEWITPDYQAYGILIHFQPTPIIASWSWVRYINITTWSTWKIKSPRIARNCDDFSLSICLFTSLIFLTHPLAQTHRHTRAAQRENATVGYLKRKIHYLLHSRYRRLVVVAVLMVMVVVVVVALLSSLSQDDIVNSRVTTFNLI